MSKAERIIIENQAMIINVLTNIVSEIGCVLNRRENTLLADKLIKRQFLIEKFLKSLPEEGE